MLVSKIKPCMSKYKQLYSETANGSLNQLSDVFIRLKTNALRGSLVIHNNFSNRTALRRRWFIQISALSTFDGWVLASRGDNG
ncbi:hypothetical protein VTK26DRAFT_1638 [Humicola hyalothermophila]